MATWWTRTCTTSAGNLGVPITRASQICALLGQPSCELLVARAKRADSARRIDALRRAAERAWAQGRSRELAEIVLVSAGAEALSSVVMASVRAEEAPDILAQRTAALFDTTDEQQRRAACKVLTNAIGLLRGLGRTQTKIALLVAITEAESRGCALNEDLSPPSEELAGVYLELGDLEQSVGNTNDARDHFERALAIYHQHCWAEPKRVELQEHLVTTLNRLGRLLGAAANYASAHDRLHESYKIAQRLFDADPSLYAGALGSTLSLLGELTAILGDHAAARGYYERDLEISRAQHDADPTNTELANTLSVAMHRLGNLEAELGHFAAARGYFEQDLSISRRLHQAEPDRFDIALGLAQSKTRLGDLLTTAHQHRSARELYAAAQQILHRLIENEPSDVVVAEELAAVTTKLERSCEPQLDTNASVEK